MTSLSLLARLGRSPWPLSRGILLALALVPLVPACAPKSVSQSERSVPRRYVNGSFIVALRDGMSLADLTKQAAGIAQDFACEGSQANPIAWGGEAMALPESLANSYHVQMKGCTLAPDRTRALMARFSAAEGITGIEAEAFAKAIAMDDDTHRDQQYYLDTIHRDEACAASARSQKPVVVAVVDTGAERDHPDLQDAFLRDASGQVVGANFVDKGFGGAPDAKWDDGEGHGTHVAGIIAAMAGNHQGIAGVAACANVRIMPIRALDDEGSGSSLEINRAIKWAVDHGANVINLSLGHVAFSKTPQPSFQDPTLAYAVSHGVAVFAAAGNDGMDNGTWLRVTDKAGAVVDEGYGWNFPASSEGVIAVAASRQDGRLATFSNYGKRVDMAAPGQDILATFLGHRYSRLSGTSMASPVAAATYALALGGIFDRTVSLKHEDVIDLLNQATNGQALAKEKVGSGGVVDVAKLVSALTERFGGDKDEPLPPGNGSQPVVPDSRQPTEPGKPTEPSDPSEAPAPTYPTDPSQPLDPNQPTEPTKPTAPATPADPLPSKEPGRPSPSVSMGFTGLVNGQKLTGALPIGLENLPRGTYRVDLYWGIGLWRFAALYPEKDTPSVLSADRWNLYGTSRLYAVAYDRQGRSLKMISVSLVGLSR